MDSLKLKFFVWHLCASIVIVFTLTIVCQYFWFPMPFLQIDGTWRALLTLGVVDVIIGPLLTLLLVSSKKPIRELVIDMIVVLIIQLTALGYGLSKIEQERVWAIVHHNDMFNLVPKKVISPRELSIKQRLPQYKNSYYAMVLDSELSKHAAESNRHIYNYPKRYYPISKLELVRKVISYDKLPSTIKAKYDSNYIFKFLAGKNKDAVVIINNSLEIIDIIVVHQ